MIVAQISNQNLKIKKANIVAGTVDYLNAQFEFSSDDWKGAEKWAHFSKDDETYDYLLTDDCINAEDHLNLSEGEWRMYLHGNFYENGRLIKRVTTNVASLYVQATGQLYGDQFPEFTPNTIELLQAKINELDAAKENITAEIEGDLSNTIASELAKHGQLYPEFANSIDECTDTSKLYVLPDGMIYAHMKMTGSPNMFELSAASLNMRISGGAETSANGYYITDYIPVDMTLADPLVMRFPKSSLVGINDAVKFMLYDADKNVLETTYLYEASVSTSSTAHNLNTDGDDYIVNVGYTRTALNTPAKASYYDKIAYVRINDRINSTSTAIKASDIPLTSITFDAQSGVTYGWTSTGHSFVPADYEGRIISVENITSVNTHDIAEIKETLEESVVKAKYPSVWNGAVEECISTIKALQADGGRNCVTFPLFSDNHQRLGYAGALIAKVMDECSLPYAFFCGDSIDSGYIASADVMEYQEAAFSDMLSPIPSEKLCRALGNHDGYYAVSANEKYHYSWEKTYDLFMRGQSTAQNKVFGGDGTYFYVEDKASKTRFVVLNTNWSHHAENADGTTNRTDGCGLGQAQLDWLVNTALKFDETGWSVVFIAHAPVTNNFHSNQRDAQITQGILTAYANKTAYSGEYSSAVDPNNNVSVSVDFSDAVTADIVGWFSGHIHRDRIYRCDHTGNTEADDTTTVNLPWHTVTITSDANISYDENEAVRDMNGDTSHAIDFVTINKSSRKVSLTRLGIGESRSYTY